MDVVSHVWVCVVWRNHCKMRPPRNCINCTRTQVQRADAIQARAWQTARATRGSVVDHKSSFQRRAVELHASKHCVSLRIMWWCVVEHDLAVSDHNNLGCSRPPQPTRHPSIHRASSSSSMCAVSSRRAVYHSQVTACSPVKQEHVAGSVRQGAIPHTVANAQHVS